MDLTHFGYAKKCQTLQETAELLPRLVGSETKSITAAMGMLLSTVSLDGRLYQKDCAKALDNLSNAKAQLDIAAAHIPAVIQVSSDILLTTQMYVYDMTIPCTEWPIVSEVIDFIYNYTKKYSTDTEWQFLKFNERGAVIGTYAIDNF